LKLGKWRYAMPKYNKAKKNIGLERKKKELTDQKQIVFSSAIKSLIVGGIFLVLSILFNGNVIAINPEQGTAIDILIILVKSVIILLFYTFVFLSVANSMELKGKPASMREIIIIAVLSLIQSILNSAVFWISLLGILVINLYFWIVQVKVETL